MASAEEWDGLCASADALRSLDDMVEATQAVGAPRALVELGARWRGDDGGAATDVEAATDVHAATDELTVAWCRDRLRSGDLSSVELVRDLLSRTKAAEHLGVYVATDPARALDAARASDRRRAGRSRRGDLDGVPVSVKDLLTTEDFPTTAQSRVADPVGRQRVDAAVVRRLRDAGAVLTGKTTLLEFACGAHDSATGFPEPRNPWDPTRWPGGSSSGAAAGVAASLVPAAIGSDTGGSIRVPAAYCGVTGFKPTFGVMPTRGCVPFSWTLDHVGPLARTAEDCALLLREICGVAAPAGDLHDVRVAFLADSVGERAETNGVAERIDAAVTVLETIVGSVHTATMPLGPALFAAGSVVIAAESYAWHRERLTTSWATYGASARLRLAGGAFVAPDAYARALQLVHAVRAGCTTTGLGADLVVLPVSDVVAPTAAALADPGALGATPMLTIPWNALGLPAISIPIGLSPSGLPVGLQIVGRWGMDGTVLAVAAALQRRTGWHRLRPPGD